MSRDKEIHDLRTNKFQAMIPFQSPSFSYAIESLHTYLHFH